MRLLIRAVLIGLLLVLPACGKKDPPVAVNQPPATNPPPIVKPPAPAPKTRQNQPGIAIVPLPLPVGEVHPIPQHLELQQKRFEDTLAWNRSTLAGAYDKVGKKDPRWDEPAHEALDAAARFFSLQTDPCIRIEEIYEPAQKAIDAGCDDPLILYLFATSSFVPHYPGLEEQERRYATAAAALEGSAYPPFRQIVALRKAANAKMGFKKDPTAEVRKEATRLCDAALAMLAQSVKMDKRNRNLEKSWFELAVELEGEYKNQTGDSQAAFDRVDAALAKIPELQTIRSQVRAQFLVHYAWEARGNGFASTVTPEGARKFQERLEQAREVLEESWAQQPNEVRTATLMLSVEKGIGGDRDEMEKWFDRAIQADSDFKPAYQAKMDWLDPKWHGSLEDMLAFGLACRDTKNWRAGITLLVADAHYRAQLHLPIYQQSDYWHLPEVRKDIQSVYEEYLQHYTTRNEDRTQYAAYCAMCKDYVEADRQFRILGDNLIPTLEFPTDWLKVTREWAAKRANQQKNDKPKH